jgi:Ca2+-transporting ATPase
MLAGLPPPIATGLSEKEASERLIEEGFNEIPSTKRRSIFSIAWAVLREPMFLLLVACGTIYLVLGDVQEALILLGFVFVVMGITLYQEHRVERALEALRDLSSPRALVIRDGELKRIPGRGVVRDDILVLAEGDRVPADSVLLSCLNFSVDESLLTGESAPVRKIPWDEIMEIGRPGGDDLPFVYSGTLVVQGHGIGLVQAVGINTEIGQIGKVLQTVETETTPLQREIGRLVRNLALLGISLCSVVVVVYGLTRGNWLKGILAGITLAMAMLPEEFPVVLTIFLAMGAWRISRKQVLTRRVPTVETLGSATVLCVDKTGTLTLNRMSVSRVFAHGKFFNMNEGIKEPLPEAFHELIEFSILASQKDPFDPMEKALCHLGHCYLEQSEHLHRDWLPVSEYPLSQTLLSLSFVYKSPNNDDYVIAAKGAPEAVFDLCHLDEAETQALARNVGSMASQGLRVLGVAKAPFRQATLPKEQHDFQFEFLGLVGFADPVRPGVPAAIKECYKAGIRVIMITGDYPVTAQSIARQIGLQPVEACLSGPELDAMDDGEFQERIKTVNIFARVLPQQKLRLVNALKARGEIVAMTGDGVNDAPALKSAHIGIAMGGRGTDVAREAAALVLVDDDFSSIVQAVKLGRRIFDNLTKAMAYIFAIHVPIAGMSLLPILFNWPLVFFPVHIAFLELIIDPACSLVFEAETEEPDVMRRRPRDPARPLFGWRTVGLSLLQGFSVLVIILVVFLVALYRGQGEYDARALTFTALIFANLGLILTNRSWSRSIISTFKKPNTALWLVLGGALTLLALVLYVPFLRRLFLFTQLHPLDLGICLAAGIISIMWFEGLKLIRKWTRDRHAQPAPNMLDR